MSEDEAARRQQEINAFAAMAAGDFSSINFDSVSVDKALQQVAKEEEKAESGSVEEQQEEQGEI